MLQNKQKYWLTKWKPLWQVCWTGSFSRFICDIKDTLVIQTKIQTRVQMWGKVHEKLSVTLTIYQINNNSMVLKTPTFLLVTIHVLFTCFKHPRSYFWLKNLRRLLPLKGSVIRWSYKDCSTHLQHCPNGQAEWGEYCSHLQPMPWALHPEHAQF